MTLRSSLALRYSLVVAVCLCLLAGLTYHEFVREPRLLRELGIQEPPQYHLAETAEVLLYGVVPAVFAGGWWFVRRSLRPVDDLVRAVEQFDAASLGERLPRSRNGDEVDRLTVAFNALAERLEASFQQVHAFTLHASHELKTPLTILRGQLETVLRDDRTLSPRVREWAEGQLDELQRLARIVDSLTFLTKADAGLVTLDQAPVAWDELVRECHEDAILLAEAQGLRATLGGCDPVVVHGDRHRLRQLLLNLVDNAVKYNRPDGSVRLELRRTPGGSELTVTNDGPGIPPELAARLFQPFVRGDEARRQSVEGCGLGLSICRWIVQAHGGTLTMASVPGGPTSFRVQLPNHPPEHGLPRT
jgi:signal transduction histidine kinase